MTDGFENSLLYKSIMTFSAIIPSAFYFFTLKKAQKVDPYDPKFMAILKKRLMIIVPLSGLLILQLWMPSMSFGTVTIPVLPNKEEKTNEEVK